ncbi:MAG: 6-phosphogluconolactonase [Gammaproteobacteria bacterium]|nr:6-phosphogluconolactonase [Gammaproteobacteria bacterium]
MNWTLHPFEENRTLVPQLATSIAETLAEAISLRGRASLAVSGGGTPRTLFDALAVIDIPWSSVMITLVDERWVDDNDPASNALLVRRHLLRSHAAAAQFLGLKNADRDPALAVAAVDKLLREQLMPLDLAVLGMGEDGHTASFFKDAEGLDAALASDTLTACCAVRPPRAPHARMTLTLNTLLASRRLLLHMVGASKLAVLHEAMQPGPVNALPVRAVLHQQRRPLEIYYATRE